MPQNITPGTPKRLGAVQAPSTGDPRNSGDLRQIVQDLLDMMAGSVQVAAPTGTVIPFAGSAVPEGWLLCDGRAVNRTDYPGLFAVIGTRFGPGNNATTFNLPDLRGRSPLGAGQGPGLTNRPLAEAGGEERHALTVQELPAHSHQAPTAATNTPGNYEVPVPFEGGSKGFSTYDYVQGAPTSSAGGNQGHNTMSPYLALTFIIRS